MTTYKEIQEQIAKLQQQAEELRKNEISTALAEIKAKMQEFGITAADLSGNSKNKVASTRPIVKAKYCDSTTGKTWSGRGKPPQWIADKDRDQFLIK